MDSDETAKESDDEGDQNDEIWIDRWLLFQMVVACVMIWSACG